MAGAERFGRMYEKRLIREIFATMKKHPVLFHAWDGSDLYVMGGEVLAVQATNTPERKAHIHFFSGADFLLRETVEEVLAILGWTREEEC